MHLHKKHLYRYFESQSKTTIDSLSSHLYTIVMICKLKKFGSHFTPEVIETSRAAAEEANKSEEEPEIVTDKDEKRKLTAG